jgi:hypothetical protein
MTRRSAGVKGNHELTNHFLFILLFIRLDSLIVENTNFWGENRAAVRKGIAGLKRNQFGGVLGGPIK